jgi:predicted secreted protein
MAATAAYVGTLKIGANTIQLVQSADLDVMAKELDTTSLGGNGWETFIMGTLSGKIALKGSLDQTDTNGQQAIITAFFNRTSLTNVIFSPDNVKTYTIATCWVTNLKMSDPATGKLDFDFSLRPSGQIVAA